uniref:(northern house mosquito) hypothetical protein n=1 Tax=Culex pipiens TaxID=7175 RepID=A0A8D8CUJ1_CULPI
MATLSTGVQGCDSCVSVSRDLSFTEFKLARERERKKSVFSGPSEIPPESVNTGNFCFVLPNIVINNYFNFPRSCADSEEHGPPSCVETASRITEKNCLPNPFLPGWPRWATSVWSFASPRTVRRSS